MSWVFSESGWIIGVGISWHLTIRFDSDSEVNDSILNRFSILNRLSIINSKTIIDASQFLKHLSLLLRVSNHLLLCVFLLEKKFFLVTIMTFYEQCNNRCSLHFNTKWMCKKKKIDYELFVNRAIII